jgi:catechol 2,3-dioxygenase-like lactoylglutathione lyase family enzyme
MGRVTGFGGLFYKVTNPERTRNWYRDTLGIGGQWGVNFPWTDDRDREAFSMLSPFPVETQYFEPSRVAFMINLRVEDLDELVASLEQKGVKILARQNEDYGRFAWILDCDGIKVELWEQRGPAPRD